MTLVDVDPLSLGAFVEIGGGSTFFDNSKRNSFITNAGVAASLTGLGAVTVTGRGFLAYYNDRHCPSVSGGAFEAKSEPTDLCQNYLDGRLNSEDKARLDELLGGPDKIFERDSRVRFMTQLAIELAFQQQWNAWVIFEGVPFQDERPAFADAINSSMFKNDTRSYVRGGLTYKF
jgi:hypothetical protein